MELGPWILYWYEVFLESFNWVTQLYPLWTIFFGLLITVGTMVCFRRTGDLMEVKRIALTTGYGILVSLLVFISFVLVVGPYLHEQRIKKDLNNSAESKFSKMETAKIAEIGALLGQISILRMEKETMQQTFNKRDYQNRLDAQGNQINEQNKTISALKDSIASKERDIESYIRKLPPPIIDKVVRHRLEEGLKISNGPRRVIISYLEDSPGGRAYVFAQQLAEIFTSAAWKVKIFSRSKGKVLSHGFAIRNEEGAYEIPQEIKDIQKLFLESGLPLGSATHGGRDLIELIEIDVGEM